MNIINNLILINLYQCHLHFKSFSFNYALHFINLVALLNFSSRSTPPSLHWTSLSSPQTAHGYKHLLS